MIEPAEPVRPASLERSDPPALGGIALTGRLESTDSGVVYAGRSGDSSVVVVMLGDGAETDSYARARFQDALSQALGDGASIVAAEDDPDIAPWAAVSADDWEKAYTWARGLLAPVALEHLPPVGAARGPAFRPHWARRRGVGRWRLWPLPWPSTLTIGARWTYLVSFALIVAISAVALFIAVKIFQNQPPAPVRPPFPLPTTGPPSPPPTPTPSPTGPTITLRSTPPVV